MTEFTEEQQKLSPDPIVELFEFDASSLGGGVYRFYSGATEDASLVWQGNAYVPIAIAGEGWEHNSKGTLPTPTIKISNAELLMSSIIRNIGDPLGAKITRWRTYEKFLDAGSEPDSTKHFIKEIFLVERKVSETEELVEFELSAAIDQDGRQLPGRQVVRSFCDLRYRVYTDGAFDYDDATCPHVDETAFFTVAGVGTGDPASDECGKKLSDCKIRFEPQGLALPYGGFPGVDRIRRQ